MSNQLKEIQAPVITEMRSFEKKFSKILSAKIPLLNLILKFVVSSKGKQIRPLLVFLSAKLHGEVTDKTYTAANLIELLHTSTLIHDDVVDESYERRGIFSIKALWKSKVAVLLGDYLLAQGLLISVENKTYDLLEIVSEAVKEMIEGELVQLQKSRGLNTDEDQYFEIIKKKTATLIAACTASGTSSITDDKTVIDRMKLLGENLGIAFQIKDDLFDYDLNGSIGKPTGNDIKEKKLTLPLIYALNNTEPSKRKHIIKLIHKNNNNDLTEIIDFVKAHGGIDYATEKMNFYKNQALETLNAYPESEIKTSFISLIEFVTNRKK